MTVNLFGYTFRLQVHPANWYYRGWRVVYKNAPGYQTHWTVVSPDGHTYINRTSKAEVRAAVDAELARLALPTAPSPVYMVRS